MIFIPLNKFAKKEILSKNKELKVVLPYTVVVPPKTKNRKIIISLGYRIDLKRDKKLDKYYYIAFKQTYLNDKIKMEPNSFNLKYLSELVIEASNETEEHIVIRTGTAIGKINVQPFSKEKGPAQ